MKNTLKSQKQKEEYISAINGLINGVEMIIQHFQENIDWFFTTVKLFSQLNETSSSCIIKDSKQHPQISSGLADTFNRLSIESEYVSTFITNINTKKAQPALESFKKQLKSARKIFKTHGEHLEDAFIQYIDTTFAPRKMTVSQDDLSNGFRMHATTLEYINNIESMERTIFNSLQEFQTVVTRYQELIITIQNEISKYVQSRFPFPIPQSIPPGTFDIEAHFKNYRVTIHDIIAKYKSPNNICLPNEYTWSDTSPQPVQMVVKDTHKGIEYIMHEKGEVVTIVNTSYGELWKVRTSNGLEGFVLSLDLQPVEK